MKGRQPDARADRLRDGQNRAVFLVESLKEMGWTQAELAEHLDVRKATVNDWIKGRSPIPRIVRLYLTLLMRTNNLLSEKNHG